MTDMMLCDVVIPWLDKLIMFYVSLVNWTLLLSYNYWWAIVTAYMDLCCGMFIMDMLNVCWWVGIRHVWCLLSNAHSVFLSLLCCRLPLYDEFMKRLLTFAQRCINCDNNLVNFVVKYAIWYGRMASPLVDSWKCTFYAKKMSCAKCPGLTRATSAQFTLKMCVAAKNRRKIH